MHGYLGHEISVWYTDLRSHCPDYVLQSNKQPLLYKNLID